MAQKPDYRDSGYYKNKTYFEIMTDAVADFCEFGFDSEDRLEVWLELLINQ